jgi:hypothetical protein
VALHAKVLVELITINPATSVNINALKEIFQETWVFGNNLLDIFCDTVDTGCTICTFSGLPRSKTFPGISVTTSPGTLFSGPSDIVPTTASCPFVCPTLVCSP